MSATTINRSQKLIVEKTERNAMLLLEFLEEKQIGLPQLKMVCQTKVKDIVHEDQMLMYHCVFYFDGQCANRVIVEQFKEYLNANQ